MPFAFASSYRASSSVSAFEAGLSRWRYEILALKKDFDKMKGKLKARLYDAKKKKIQVENEVAAICRCGSSKKKPFCDGSHQTVGFTD